MMLFRRLRFAWGMWGLIGYDGEPTTWSHAWEIAGKWYPTGEIEAAKKQMRKQISGRQHDPS